MCLLRKITRPIFFRRTKGLNVIQANNSYGLPRCLLGRSNAIEFKIFSPHSWTRMGKFSCAHQSWLPEYQQKGRFDQPDEFDDAMLKKHPE